MSLHNKLNRINIKLNLARLDDDISLGSREENISLLEISPNYITANFDSTPKTTWKPPNPVILNNFENSIGNQLGDITKLTT